MVPPAPDRSDAVARGLLAAVCAVVLIVPIFIGDHEAPGLLPESRVERTAAAADAASAAPERKTARRPELPAPPAEARRRAARLALPELAAQVLLVGFEGFDPQAPVFGELREHGWGGIVIGPDNALTVEQIGVLAGEADAVSREARRLPPLVVAEPNGAPAQPALAEAMPARARRRTRAAARRLDRIGVDLVLAPSADVATPGPLADRAFSDDPAIVTDLTRAAVDGWTSGGIAPAPGHFPGQGAASQDPLDGPAAVGLSREELAGRDLAPFKAVLDRVPAVRVSSAAFTAYDPVTPAALVPAVTRRLLRGSLRFNGVAMSDDLASLSAATAQSPAATAVSALRSGIDLVHVADPAQRNRVRAAVLAAARSGKLPVARLREAAARVLELKRRGG